MFASSLPGQVLTSVWPVPGCTVFHMQFDCAGFQLAQFAGAGIDLPEAIAKAAPKRQASYFYGRLCSLAALGHAGAPAMQVGSGSLREPLWPAGIVGSITHSAATAAAIVAPASDWAGIGIDIETISGRAESDALAATIVSADERAIIAACRQLDRDTALTLVFSAKESFYKAVFGMVRQVLDFDAIELVGIDPARRCMWFEVRQPLGNAFKPGARLAVDYLIRSTHVMTLCRLASRPLCTAAGTGIAAV